MRELLLTAAPMLMVLCLSGYGLALQTLLAPKSHPAETNIFDTALYGLLAVTTVALIANFFVGLSTNPGPFVLAGGLALFVLQVRRVRALEQLSLLVVVLAVVYFLGSEISFSFDAGLYHVPAMDWIAFEPAPLGLANLHSRLGFNSAFLLFESAFRSEPLLGWNHLYICEIATRVVAVGWLANRALSEAKTGGATITSLVYAASLIVVLVFLSRFARTSTDTCAHLLSICAWASFCKLVLIEDDEYRSRGGAELSLLMVLSTLAITFKVSMLPIAAFVPAVFFLRGWRETSRVAFSQKAVILLLAVYFGLWLARNFLLSGCFVYPAPISCVQVPWGVGSEAAQQEQAIVRGWARHPGTGFRDFAPMTNLAWLPDWFERLADSFPLRVLMYSGLFLLLSLIATWRHEIFRHTGGVSKVLWPSISVMAASLVFWFVTAPNPRFATAYFAILSATLIFAGLVRIRDVAPALNTRAASIAAIVFGLVAASTLPWARVATLMPPSQASKTRTIGDWAFYKPAGGQKCWTLFPCTPQKPSIARVETTHGRTIFVRQETGPGN